MTKFYTYYNRRKPVYTDVGDSASMTDQSFKQECDLKTIIDTYKTTNTPIPVPTMNYVDCTTVMDFQTAMALVTEAKDNFRNLPAATRDRFGNVEKYLEFINAPENLEYCLNMNLVDPSSVPQELIKQLEESKLNNLTGDGPSQPVQPSVDVIKDVTETQAG